MAGESGPTPARALLNHRQARSTQSLFARPRGGDGPEEVLRRERSALTTRLRAAATLRPSETVERQQWGGSRRFLGRIIVEERAGALTTANELRRRDTVWTEGSRLNSSKVRAACVWQSPGGWTGRRSHLGSNKEVFDAGVFAIYNALRAVDQRQESCHRYAVFVDSTSAIDRVRTDAIGLGQRLEVCDRVLARENVNIRWVPTHHGIQDNEKADAFAKAAAGRPAPCSDDDVPDELWWRPHSHT